MKFSFIKCFNLIDLKQITSIIKYGRKLTLFCLPFFAIILAYFVWDPYRIIYRYDNFYRETDYFISKNRDYVSSSMYINNYKKYLYDSFIFGSSNALFMQPSTWCKYTDSTSSIFSFDASRENIVGIWSKIRYIHNNNGTIKNVLLVFDTGVTFDNFSNKGRIFRKHFTIYPSSKIIFHAESLLTFLDFKYIVAILHLQIGKEFRPYMKGVLEPRYFSSNIVTNEVYFEGPIRELKTDSLNYYKQREKIFHTRSGRRIEAPQQIQPRQIQMLREINEIFLHDSTHYRIIITPHYNQVSFNSKDLEILKRIFIEDLIFDFSGINGYTAEKSNYYDADHFKQYIGQKILDSIY